jgi:hypothetical protein
MNTIRVRKKRKRSIDQSIDTYRGRGEVRERREKEGERGERGREREERKRGRGREREIPGRVPQRMTSRGQYYGISSRKMRVFSVFLLFPQT